MSDREGYLKRRDQLLAQDERIALLEAVAVAAQVVSNRRAEHYHRINQEEGTGCYKELAAHLDKLKQEKEQ